MISSGFLLGAILLHAVVFLMVATWVVFAPPAEVPDIVFTPVIVKPPPPPPPAAPAPAGGGSQNPLEPQPIVTPPSNPPSIVHISAQTDFNVTPSKTQLPNLPDSFTEATGSSIGDSGATGAELGSGNPFGKATSDQQSFSGTFYDLKQTPNHASTKMGNALEATVLKDFIANGWDEDSFKKQYLSSQKPLFANELLIPFQASTSGPAAFGLANECKPGYWVVVYHVKITPTRSGDFTLAGYGDDYLVARVNGVNVLDAGWYPALATSTRVKSYPVGPWAASLNQSKGYLNLISGSKFHIKAGDDLTIDVLIGDGSAGGHVALCGYFLFLLQNANYPKDTKGNYVLPALQVHADSTVKRDGIYQPFTCKSEDALVGAY